MSFCYSLSENTYFYKLLTYSSIDMSVTRIRFLILLIIVMIGMILVGCQANVAGEAVRSGAARQDQSPGREETVGTSAKSDFDLIIQNTFDKQVSHTIAQTLQQGSKEIVADDYCWVNPVKVGITSKFIYVYSISCVAQYPGVEYFAYPTSDPLYKDMWALILSSFGSAPKYLSESFDVKGKPLVLRGSQRGLYVGFDKDDTSGESWGCSYQNCRTIRWIEGGEDGATH